MASRPPSVSRSRDFGSLNLPPPSILEDSSSSAFSLHADFVDDVSFYDAVPAGSGPTNQRIFAVQVRLLAQRHEKLARPGVSTAERHAHAARNEARRRRF